MIEALLGKSYELGADGSGSSIDCIHLCVAVLDDLGIKRPLVNQDWYKMSRLGIVRELLHWGNRINKPLYDGDIILFSKEAHAFGVTWQQGALYINDLSKVVQWCPLHLIGPSRYFRGKDS